MLFFVFLSLISSEEWKIPQFKDVGSGWNGWPHVLLPFSAMFNKMKIADYIVHANVDFAKIMSNAVTNTFSGKMNTTQLFLEKVYPSLNDDYVYTGKPSDLDFSFDGLTDQIMDGDKDSEHFFIGLLIGLGFTIVLIVIFFIVLFFYCLYSCCCCCCCCKPREFSRPSIFAHICFYIGVAFLVVVTIAVFYMIRPMTSIISAIQHFPDAGSELVGSGNITITNVFSLLDEVPTVLEPIADNLSPAASNLVNNITDFLTVRINDLKDLVMNGAENTEDQEFKSITEILSDIVNSINDLNEAVELINKDFDENSQKLEELGQTPPDIHIDPFDFSEEISKINSIF